MSLVAFDGTPLVLVGNAGRESSIVLVGTNNTTQDAALESCQMIGQIFTEDGGSHTIDTTGSSSLGFKQATVTLANVGSAYKVGLATVDASAGPPGRATNSTDTITFSVSKSYSSAAKPTASAWNEGVPDAGTMTIAHGDTVAFCTQMVTRGGADSILTTTGSASTAGILPFVTTFTGGAYAAPAAIPNAVITFSDGTLGFFYGSQVFTTPTTTQTWNSGSSPNEYGNFLQMPFPAKIYGGIANCTVAGDTDFVLYSTPLGTPAAEKTVSSDLNVVGASAVGNRRVFLFSSPYSATASQPLAIIMKPTSVTNTDAPYMTFNASAHQKSLTYGVNGYAVNRASGAFAAQNSSKDRFAIGLLVGAFDNAASAAGLQYRNVMRGNVG